MRKKREREAHLPGLTRAATRAGPVPQPAQPTSSSLVLFLLCQEDEQRRGVALADAASATSCFPPPSHLLLPPWPPQRRPDDATRLPDRPSLPPELSPSSVSLSLSDPSGAAATDEHHRSHRLPLDPSLCLRAPPQPPPPPR